MPPTSITAKFQARYSAPNNPELDSSALFECNISPDTLTTPTLALGMVKSPIVISLISPVPTCSTRPSPASSTNRVPQNTNPSLARDRFVHGRHRGTRIYDHSCGMAIEHGRDFEVIA